MSSKFTTRSFYEAKAKNEKIAMLTAYDYSMAQILDNTGIDAILVGDSLGMVMQGRSTTLEVTMDEMVYHCKCVSQGVKSTMVIGDLPFLSYHVSKEEAIRNAGRLIKEGLVQAVKLEGGKSMAGTIKAITDAQIPVMGHIGLTPQSVHVFGGFRAQGKEEAKARALIEDALALEEAGVFAIVLEAIPEELAGLITKEVKVATISIGAGRYCNGQILVTEDILGLYSGFSPKFVKQYANLKNSIAEAVTGFIGEVKQQQFPEKIHTYTIDETIIEKLRFSQS